MRDTSQLRSGKFHENPFKGRTIKLFRLAILLLVHSKHEGV